MKNLQTNNPSGEGFIFASNLQNGSTGGDVKDFQIKLKQLGYYKEKIDGVFGKFTITSTKEFQLDYELHPDGIVGPITRRKVEEVLSSTSTFQILSRHMEIRTLQRQLNSLGLYHGEIDGIFGQGTDLAVRKFQQDNGLAVDGIVGSKTKNALKKKLLDGYTSSNPDIPQDPTNGKVIVTAEHLKKLGWHNINDKMLKDLYGCIEQYQINHTLARVRHFISQCTHESDYGRSKIEYETFRGSREKYKGAGYIQITGRSNYQMFQNEIGDARIMEGARYVAEAYPWKSAGFWWKLNNMNTHCDAGESATVISKRVNCGNPTCKHPRHLPERIALYRLCEKVFVSTEEHTNLLH